MNKVELTEEDHKILLIVLNYTVDMLTLYTKNPVSISAVKEIIEKVK